MTNTEILDLIANFQQVKSKEYDGSYAYSSGYLGSALGFLLSAQNATEFKAFKQNIIDCMKNNVNSVSSN